MYQKKFILFHGASVSGRCALAAATLLMLSNYVDENGYNVEKPSTLMPRARNEKKLQSSFTTLIINQVSDKSQMICIIGILDQKN